MIVVLSPSKSMEMKPVEGVRFSQPAFLGPSKKLIRELRRMSTPELMDFMAISEKLAALNHPRFKEWKTPFSTDNAKQAALAFTGDVYDGLDAPTLDPHGLDFAQDHLRILSGLYGLLRPLDLIQPYRLEMGRPLETPGAKNLYAFWKERVTAELNALEGELLVNLASVEYSKVIDRRRLKKKIISPVFKDEKNGQLKIISFYAKKARGYMARFILENQITDAQALNQFCANGYAYHAPLSTPTEPVFTRSEKA